MIFTFFGGVLIGSLLPITRLYDEKTINEKLKMVINNIESENDELIRTIKKLKNQNQISTEVSEIMHNSGTIVDKYDKIKELIDCLDKSTNSK